MNLEAGYPKALESTEFALTKTGLGKEFRGAYCSCHDCIFKETIAPIDAIAHNIDPETQVGCKLDKIDAFIKICASVEFDPRTHSFYINKYCKWFRDQEWSEKHNNSDLTNIVNKETEFKWSAIIELNKIDCLKNAIDNVLAEPIKPQVIIIITKRDVSSIISICNSQIKDTAWIVEQPIDEQSVDRCIQGQYYRNNLNKCSHYVWFLDDAQIYSGFTKDINSIINDHMIPLMAVLPKRGNHGVIVNKSLHSLFYIESNHETILDKIKLMFSENQEMRDKHIMSWERAMTTRWT